jgi:hypothetical protein
MHWDSVSRSYTLTTELKQGYHEYMYVTLSKSESDSSQVEYLLTEGNKAETSNSYYIYFYIRNQFLNYQELVGYQKSNSNTN